MCRRLEKGAKLFYTYSSPSQQQHQRVSAFTVLPGCWCWWIYFYRNIYLGPSLMFAPPVITIMCSIKCNISHKCIQVRSLLMLLVRWWWAICVWLPYGLSFSGSLSHIKCVSLVLNFIVIVIIIIFLHTAGSCSRSFRCIIHSSIWLLQRQLRFYFFFLLLLSTNGPVLSLEKRKSATNWVRLCCVTYFGVHLSRPNLVNPLQN